MTVGATGQLVGAQHEAGHRLQGVEEVEGGEDGIKFSAIARTAASPVYSVTMPSRSPHMRSTVPAATSRRSAFR
jgi:hypothetical protein